jgi:hypothetical protein
VAAALGRERREQRGHASYLTGSISSSAAFFSAGALDNDFADTISRRCPAGFTTRNAHPEPNCFVAASVKRD